jgi:EAL domain-containing protein (putative c-di-GMP-specific phosphodiesterase class I)
VDRPALVTHLRALGVDDGQGFHLGRPLPLDGLLAEL